VPRVVAVDPEAPEPAIIAEAAAVLARGGLVAFPTETVYGLGARGLHREDVLRIFVAKGRPAGHPLILHVDGEAMARPLGTWSAAASRFAEELWPGPLTLIVPRAEVVPLEATGGMETVGLRVPSHRVALALIRTLGEPIAAPSANAHMHVSPTTAQHVVSSLGDAVDLVLDGGRCTHGIESTVLAFDASPPRVLRPGATTLARLRAIEPAVTYSPLVVAGEGARASPGMASKHYAPRARVVVAGAAEIAAEIGSARAGTRVAAIVVSEAGRQAAAAADPCMVLPGTAEGYARELYAALHRVDEAGADVVVVEDVPTSDPAWWAVADRLFRARQILYNSMDRA
jgi:L-threonylcarbamoyladenylate synthase